jgi:gliding motility-associated-like protein
MFRIFVLAILITGMTSLHTMAQVCTGSLGDPVLNETFGSSGFMLPSYKTTYQYIRGCPSKGTYTLSSFLFGCGPRTWVQLVGDHTGDYNGNYMLVNAESQPGIVYQDTIKNLCSGTVYQFGVWITRVMEKIACNNNPVLPNIIYQLKTLDGTVLAIDSTGLLPVGDDKEWKLYNLMITTPSNVSDIKLEITINPPFGCGSAFAMDDITLRPCGPSVVASIDGGPGPLEVCGEYNNPFLMTATYSAGFANPVLQWQSSIDTGKTWQDIPGATSANYAVPHRASDDIEYRVCIAETGKIASLSCRVTSNAIYTGVHPQAAHFPPQAISGCLGKNYLFPKPDPTAITTLWTGPNGYSSDQQDAGIPNIQYADTGLYLQKQTFYYGCVSLDSFYLKIFPGTTLSVQPSTAICEGQSEQLSASATDNVTYQWTPPSGLSNNTIANPIASPTDSTRYKLLITNQYGCKDSAVVTINVYRNPKADAGTDKTILKGDTAILNGVVSGTGINYYWLPDFDIANSTIATPSVYPPVTSNYTLHVVSTLGCGEVSDDVQVKVYNGFGIPNAFSPNGDGKNDKFEILPLDNYKLVHLFIYNRWGQVVFKSTGSYAGWDGYFKGSPQPQGIYVYELELQAPARSNIIQKGTILLVR